MEEMKVYTMEQWGKDGMFKAQPGQFVENAVYAQMLECVPPLCHSHDYMQVGEAYGTCPKTGWNTYTTFVKEGDMWKFYGNVTYGEGRPKLKEFCDLKFEPHPTIRESGSLQAVMNFGNGYGVSVLLGEMFYSNGVDTYEVAVLKDGHLCYDTPITDDVLPRLSEEEVTYVMHLVQML